jgi:hypothetical protein
MRVLAFGQQGNGTVACARLCPAVTLQMILSTNNTITYKLANGQPFTALSIQNAYLLAPQGKATLDVGQSVPIVLRPIARQAH